MESNFKNKIKDNFTIIPNSIIQDKRISVKALGLFVYLASKPSDWRFSSERISNDFRDGITSIRASLTELEKYNYLSRIKITESGKFKGIAYVINSDVAKADDVKTVGVKPDDGFSDDGKPNNISNTNNTNTELSNTILKISPLPPLGDVALLELENLELKKQLEVFKAVEAEKEKEKSLAAKKEKVDFDFMKKAFNENCTYLSNITSISEKRKIAINARLKEANPENVNDFILGFFQKAHKIDWINGRKKGFDWRADFDYLFTPKGFIKILEEDLRKNVPVGQSKFGIDLTIPENLKMILSKQEYDEPF